MADVHASIGAEENNEMNFRQGVRDCIPTLLGYISIGIAAGVIGIAAGLSALEVVLLAVLVYAGSAQFIFAALVLEGSPAAAIILTIFIVNLRHFLMSATLAPHFTQYSVWQNIGSGILLTDETFGVASVKTQQKQGMTASWMNGLNVTAYICWIISCAVGAIFGNWIADPEALGLDFALTSMFIALLVLQLDAVESTKIKHYIRLILCIVILMIGFSFFVSSHMAVLLATILGATIGVVTEK
ncbi:AzlC family ABC transporter permease [Terribacillus saccharophilus]|uniref:Branched-chain amino acid ABC transporter permease n=1 Tax=Terribacillus saccharophilus TaxID=361277 RepID=A0ABX4GXQ6_9BACI|nr:AzlC family ABC transporter permease [Terribacillus saccharophilus]PAD35320.1 branched-chain amino acid ABC transporter permease [Terribacillus saccharophilus]PAD96075.1 branched-chain amino acid ABC transporter permease [Terribacillus saccharophilus]PAD99589.1 branched-chain amino acid ABC transporter permease [Terribacillus saccharophilus]